MKRGIVLCLLFLCLLASFALADQDLSSSQQVIIGGLKGGGITKEQTMALMTQSQNSDYTLTTSCGDSTFGCASFFHDPDGLDEPEGLVEEDLTLVNTHGDAFSTTFDYVSPNDADCTALVNLTMTKDGVEQDITDALVKSTGMNSNCIITLPIIFDSDGQEIDYKLIMDNYEMWDVLWYNDNINALNSTLQTYCDNVATINNITYQIPLNQTTQSGDIGFCQRVLDDLYYANKYYDEAIQSTTLSEISGAYSELDFYYPLIRDHYTAVTGYNIQNLILTTAQLRNETGKTLPADISFIGGTEYQVGDSVKVFLQLLNGSAPINNATCGVNIYYPNNTLWQTNQSMVYQNGSNGLYFWVGVAPNLTGVYMVDASCRYNAGNMWAFSHDSLSYPTNITSLNGTFAGSAISLNDYQDALHTITSSISGRTDTLFDYNLTGMNLTNVTSAILYWMGQTIQSENPTLTFQIYNWTSNTWIVLPNIISLIGSGTADVTGQNDVMVTNTIPLADTINGANIIRIRVNSSTGVHHIGTNWQAIDFLNPSVNAYDNVRGGGELHVSNFGITQATGIQSVIDYLTNTIYPYLTQMWNKLLGIETQLNTTINITNQTLNLSQEINQTTHKTDADLLAVNASMIAGFAEKDAHIQSAYNNMTSQVTNLSQNVSQNFNQTLIVLQELNSSIQANNNSLILSYLINLTNTLNNTQTQIANVNQSLTNNMNSINQSISQQLNISTNSTQTLIYALNTSSQERFDQLQSLIDNLSVQVSQNQNLTQTNISQLESLILSLNISLSTGISDLNTSIQQDFTALNATLAEMKFEISNTENMTILINQSVVWIMTQLNVSTADLSLIVTAPSKCLADTNWLARAQVKDRYGNILSYLDDVQCNMTTDLWNTSNMSYSFTESNFKYIHVCDPTATIFNWSVNCGRT